MSTTAEATYVCEACATPLQYKGGPHMPRWCAEHREGGGASQRRAAGRRAPADIAAAVDPPVHCQRCHTRMLTPHRTGQCGLCLEEQNFPSDNTHAARFSR